MPLSIRQALPGDLDRIILFNLAMARETEGRDLDRAVLARGVRRVLEDPARGRYFVAERPPEGGREGEEDGSGGEDGEIVGQLMVTTEWSDWRDGEFWWIQSVYVSKRCRREGVYRTLHEHVRSSARRAGAVGLRLYVERDNLAAQETYRSLGMHESAYRLYEQTWA